MILVELLIENYKQYAGQHRIAIPSDATVGIIGANGVGKTTLFEAIEWCLYNPLGIRNEQVRPRGLASHTSVAVTMDRPESGERFIVERELKRAGVSAAIYRVADDGSETVVVQGTRQVSDFVATRLIGLGHAAFVSTFFTRQKELSFFGHMGETERRREVGRLLGLETIRAAQEKINDERKQAKAEADSLRRQYEDQSHGRDFATELAGAEAEIGAAEKNLQEVNERLAAATGKLTEAAERRQCWQSRKDEDTKLHRDLVGVDGKLNGVNQRARLQEGELARLAKRAGERERLRVIAAAEATLAQTMSELDAEHERFRQQRGLERDLDRLAREHRHHVSSVQTQVLTVTLSEQIDGWSWSDADSAAPLLAVGRLRATLADIDLTSAEAHAEALVRCQEAAVAHHEASKKLALYLARRQEIDAERQDLLAGGDPRAALAENDTARNGAQVALSEANARVQTLSRELDQTDELLQNLRQSKFDDACPTCARPFAAGEERLVIQSLLERREALEHRIGTAQEQAKMAQERQRALHDAGRSIEERNAALQTVMGRLIASEPFLQDQRGTLNEAEDALQRALSGAGLSQAPERQVVAQATGRAAMFRDLLGKMDALADLETRMQQGDSERETTAAELAALGAVLYDAARHQTVIDELRHARDAIAALAEIERDLARRPAVEADIEVCRAEIAQLSAERTSIEQARAEVAFDAAALAQAVADEAAAQTAERAARDSRHSALLAHRDATQRRDAVREAQERIAQLAARADCRGRDADELDVMVREFNAFEKFVAGRYGPILAETTSELVGQVTDGRYDRVEFDESYGIEVYDGDDEKFPLATFSGGEHDAIALCARLALSRMVGSQAVSPPSFLVLDEVFGSLDRDRRARLLDLLGSLAGATEQLHQLFVISHVDDVREAPAFDEVWRIEESTEGVSQIANATREDLSSGEAE